MRLGEVGADERAWDGAAHNAGLDRLWRALTRDLAPDERAAMRKRLRGDDEFGLGVAHEAKAKEPK
jgi:hypothetical protein